jgi:hypothetical protein
MTRKKQGRKHALVLYKRALDRLWMPMFSIALLLGAALWLSGRYWEPVGYIPAITEPYDILIYLVIVFSLVFTIYAVIARSLAYVQAKNDHLYLFTPLLALKISYRRVKRTGLATIGQIFPAQSTRRSIRSIVEAYDGRTSVILELKGYPVARVLLHLLLGRSMLLPNTQGLVLLVNDWMEFSTELDSLQGSWRQAQSRPAGEAHPGYNLLQNLRK